jgi:uncharacterized protein (DUF342 family)
MAESNKLSSEELAKLREQLKKEASHINAGRTGSGDDSQADQGYEKEEIRSAKEITVEVSEDRMKATVRLAAPNMNESYSVPEVIAALRSNRVVLGIDSQAINEMINLGHYEEDTVVAQGKEEVQGTDGYFEWFVDLEKHETPEIREDGTVDYTAMNKLANINEGDKIAVYHPAVQGEKGFDVSGAEKIPRIAKEQNQLRGKYIRYDMETLEYFATLSGKISLNGNAIEILSVHEVNDDLDMTYGTVEFYGDIVINGNVEAGAVIRAGRNVTINGTVAAGKVFAGGDVVLTKGAQGKSKISARGDIYAEFIEYATVDAVGEVHANYIMNSQVNSSKKVFVDGKKGSVLGGYTHGLSGVEVRNAGNYNELKTELHSGFSNEDYEKYNSLIKREDAVNNELAEVISEMTDLLKTSVERGATQAQKDRIYELNIKKDTANAQIDEIGKEKHELAAKMAEGTNSYIEIKGDTFRNTIISIDAATLVLQREESCVRFVCKNGVIERRQAHLDKND